MKLMKRTPIKCHMRTNKLIYGHSCTLSYESKKLIASNMSYLEMRGEEDLL